MSYLPSFLPYQRRTFKSLSEAVDDLESTFNGQFSLGNNQIVILAEKGPAFGVTQNHPFQTHVLEMFGTDLPSVCAVSVVRTVLGSNSVGKSIAGVQGQDGRDMESHRGNDNIYGEGIGTDIVRVELDIVDGILNKIKSLGVGLVGLPVAGNQPLVSGEQLPQE